MLGKHSGRAGLRTRARELGYDLSEEELGRLYNEFIALADKKKEVYGDDLRMLILAMYHKSFEVYHLNQMRTSGSDPTMALVKLTKGDETFTETAIGDGPVHAACSAIERIVGVNGRLERFDIRAATPGKDALGAAYVSVNFDGVHVTGNGASTDIIEAAVQAYLNAINKYLALSGDFERPEAEASGTPA